ncbi:hypothetical protein Tco_0128792 [Tanacetum coccineum]
MKQSQIPIVKVRWNSWRCPEFTWEREDFFMRKYLHLFPSKKQRHDDNRASGRHSRLDFADCFQVLGTCGELDAFVSIPDEGDMAFLRKKVKSGAAVGKLVLLQGCYSAGETKNLKKPSQTPKDFPVGQKMGFKPKQVYQPVSKKHTANTSRNKNKNVEPTKENVNSSSPNTTPVIEKIDKIEKLIIDGKVTLVNDEGKPLEKVDYLGVYDSEDEVASVDNEMASFLANKDGYGTQSLLEQWKESYENGDYEYDPYDDDMYKGQDILDKLQAICDNLDIKVRGRKKK